MTIFHLSDAGFLLGRRLVQSHIQLHRNQTFNLSLKHHVDRQSVLHGQCQCLMAVRRCCHLYDYCGKHSSDRVSPLFPSVGPYPGAVARESVVFPFILLSYESGAILLAKSEIT